VGIGFWLDFEGRRIQRLCQEKNPKQKTHDEYIKNSLNNNGTQTEPFAHIFFLSHIQGFYQFPNSSGKNEDDRKTNSLAGKEAEEFDTFFLVPEEDAPTEAARGEVQRSKGDNENEKRNIDVSEVPKDLFPLDAPEEKIEKN
jgi:hypothetical protein